MNSKVDLSFDRILPTSSTARKAIGKKLAGIERIQISVVADGFVPLDDLWLQPFSLTANTNPQESRVVFRFRAGNQTKENAGFHVYLDHNGTLLYHFWIRVQVVMELGKSEAIAKELQIDLDEIARVLSRTRDLKVSLWAQDQSVLLYFTLETQIGMNPRPPLSLNVDQLHQAVKVAQNGKNGENGINAVANQTIWKHWDPGYAEQNTSLLPDAEAIFKSATKTVAEQGWRLRQALSRDDGLKAFIDTVEALPDGSRITVQTNSLGVPWDILYAKDPWTHDEFDAQAFWGMRYQIECFRINIPRDGGVVRDVQDHQHLSWLVCSTTNWIVVVVPWLSRSGNGLMRSFQSSA